jgi:hypothetical protein
MEYDSEEPYKKDKFMGTSPIQLLKIMLVEHNNNLIMSYEQYYKIESRSCIISTSLIRARTICLFQFLYAPLKKDLNYKTFIKLESKVYSEKLSELKKAFNFLQLWLYKKNLLKIDNIREYDMSNPEEENIAKGYD